MDLKELPTGTWDLYNLGGDALALVAHCIVGILVLSLIETDIFSCLTRFTLRSPPARNTGLDLDEDVIAEEERILNQTMD